NNADRCSSHNPDVWSVRIHPTPEPEPIFPRRVILARGPEMGMLDHWQPVLLSRRLRHRPVGVQVAGARVALFRTSTGEPAAVSDACPHRRLKLSAGDVVGDRIRCKYHGWQFDACGYGESPAAPKM